MSRSKTLLLLASAVLVSACGGKIDPGAALGQGALSSSDEPAAVVTVFPVHPADVPITVKAANGRLVDVTVTAADGTSLAGASTDGGRSWTSTAPLGYGRTYQVLAYATGDNGKPVTYRSRIRTVHPPKAAAQEGAAAL